MKFKSSRLKEFDYNVLQNFDEAKENGEIIALADNQILRSIRDIKNHKIDLDKLENWFSERDKLKKQKHSDENVKRIKELQNNINNMMFIPEYITIVMEHPSHYKFLFENGLIINNRKYIRFSCSASQARVSTVVFCEEEIAKKLKVVLDNGRDLNKKLVPSKFNAYLGLSGSATQKVSSPNFCVIPDYEDSMDIMVNFVTETDWEEDDHIEIKTINQKFNRFDGQGLISYEKASEWAKELGLDYTPSQWCIRQNYVKGMLCTFPIHEFCETENNKNYIVDTVYKDKNGNPKKVDLRNIDVILSESMFKLWDSFDNLEIYEENCKKNNLTWGVSLYTPKEDKDILKMNYQFIQTLNWNSKDIEKVCQKFVNWIDGVNSENIYYTLLFLLGRNANKETIEQFLKSGTNYWLRSLVLNHDLLQDKYIKKKIYDLIKIRIKRGCLGDIIVDGNFQVLVSDPYAMMQHICGNKVTGLLNKNEYYSNYWNKKGVNVVNSMRPPLTYRSEHLMLNLVDNEELRHWYRYCNSGIIVNVFGMETLHWAGSDFDFDQIATTSDPTTIRGIFKNELPVVYEPPKSESVIIEPQNLFEADLFAFGSIIGSITNKSTTGYSILSLFEKDSKEYITTMNRLKMCTKLQSAQIDKAKIGKEVKGIPKKWVEYQKIKDGDSEEIIKEKEFNNRILLGRHPYFFIYLYQHTKSKYNKHVEGYNISSKQKFGISLTDLLNKKRKTKAEKDFIDIYYRFMPVINSDSVMNLLCRHIESIDFNIKQKIKVNTNPDIYKLYLRNGITHDGDTFSVVLSEYKKFNKALNNMGNMGIFQNADSKRYDESIGLSINGQYEEFKRRFNNICSNTYELVNYLVRIFYVEYKGSNKDLLWNTYGKYIFHNIKQNSKDKIFFPFPDDEGDIEYLNKKYSLKEVVI
jgi:hypothetical protein